MFTRKERKMHYEILDKKRKDILPLLAKLRDDFYLAGGTALALHLGHRDSVDFDFFTQKDIDTAELTERLKEIFKNHGITKIQEEKNTLSVLINKEIKLSFFTYKYPLLKDLHTEKNLSLASLEDIGCMKLSAILGRSSNKDYIDIYYILKNIELETLLGLTQQKFPEIDPNPVLKSLVYFEDMEEEPIDFQKGKEVELEEIKNFLIKEVKKFYNC